MATARTPPHPTANPGAYTDTYEAALERTVRASTPSREADTFYIDSKEDAEEFEQAQIEERLWAEDESGDRRARTVAELRRMQERAAQQFMDGHNKKGRAVAIPDKATPRSTEKLLLELAQAEHDIDGYQEHTRHLELALKDSERNVRDARREQSILHKRIAELRDVVSRMEVLLRTVSGSTGTTRVLRIRRGHGHAGIADQLAALLEKANTGVVVPQPVKRSRKKAEPDYDVCEDESE